jgi:hypothetical protein
MLRRSPSTLLVCLVISISIAAAAPAWADNADQSLEVLLKPDKGTVAPVSEAYKARPRYGVASARASVTPRYYGRISKVKAPPPCGPRLCVTGPPCILPTPKFRQWEVQLQVLWARARGMIQWPRQSQFTFNQNNEVDLNDDLALPAHDALLQFSIRYQFRPRWAFRYSILGDEFNGGRGFDNNTNRIFWFGNQQINSNQPLQSKWEHQYHRLGLIYDAVKTCTTQVSVFADWVHTDDVVSLSCNNCGNQTATFSISGTHMIAGIEVQRCARTFANGGTLSLEHKAGFIFLDDVEGWDLQTGGKYSIPLNCGRWGYLKGGYRFVEIRRAEARYIFNHALEGGFMEFGFIF